MLIGLVKWFDQEKGFGVLGTPNGEEYFLHINSFRLKPEKLLIGMPIAFIPKADKTKNRNLANNSRLVVNAEDWKTILSYLGKSDSVQIEVARCSSFGNQNQRKEIQSFSLVGISLEYFLKDKNEEKISNIIIDYYNKDLDSKLFISYCELIEVIIPKHFSCDIASNILNRVFSHFSKNLNKVLSQLDMIRNNDDFNNYNRLLQLIPNQFANSNKIKISEAIHQIISQKCSDEYKAELWFKGIIKEAPFEQVTNYFFEKNTQPEKQITILSKLETDKQFELLKKYSDELNFEKAFELLGGLLKKENSFDNYYDFSKVLFDRGFWKDKKGSELIDLFTDYVNTQSNDERKYELFLKGYVKNVPQNIVRKNTHQLAKEDCKKIFKTISENISFIKEILTEKVTLDNTSSLIWLYDLAIEFLDQENFNSFDKKVFDTIEQSEYFKFWEIGKAKLFPQNKIEEILQDKFEHYTQIKKWIENKATTTEEISEFLFSFLHRQVLVTDRIIFYKQLNHIKYLLQLNELHLEKIKQINNDFYNVILWALDKENVFDFDLLKQKFIYFAPDEQVRIIRKLFLLKANGQFDLTIEKLNELTRFDLDLYKTNLKFNPEIPIDISTDVVIKALLSYQQNQRFFVESELLTVILNDLKLDKTRRFRLSNYFEKCLGRQTAEYNWNRNGEISKVKYGDNKFYYAISFEYAPNLVEALIIFEKKRFYKQGNESFGKTHWGVPAKYETEVLTFAKEQRFFLDFEGSKYANNTHFANFKREDIPNGISFCEGRLANKKDEIFKKEFYWCKGNICHERCEAIHIEEQWEEYTLLDFLELLELNTDSKDNFDNVVSKGKYYEFIGFINRFNRLLQHLYCNECSEILHPAEHGWFTVNNVIRFKCINKNCKENEKKIYLNHCLNGKCQSIIDNRTSEKCPNGVYICKDCGSCCSQNFFDRRLKSININDYLDNPQKMRAYIETKRKYDNKLGHLDRGEYFCYKCKSLMTEISNDIFQCSNCNVKYDTTKYKFKRPHIHLRKTKTTTGNNWNNDEKSNDNDFDVLF